MISSGHREYRAQKTIRILEIEIRKIRLLSRGFRLIIRKPNQPVFSVCSEANHHWT